MFDSQQRALLARLPTTSLVATVSVAPDGSQLLIADEGEDESVKDGVVDAYSIVSGDVTRVDLSTLRGSVPVDAMFTADGSQFLVPTDDGHLYLFDSASLMPVDVELPDSPLGLAGPAPDGTLAIGGATSVTFWDPASNTAVRTVELESPGEMQLGGFAFSSDMRWLAGAEGQGRTVVWDLADGRLIGDPSTRPQVTRPIAFDPTEPSILAIGSADGGITMHDVVTGQQIGEPLRGQPGGARALAFSDDGRLLATTNDDGTIGLWTERGGPSLLSTPLDDRYRLFDASADGNIVVVGDRSTAEVRRLDAPEARPIVLSPPTAPSTQVWWDVSADGNRVLGLTLVDEGSGEFAYHMRIHDTETGEVVWSTVSHDLDYIPGLSHDGSILAFPTAGYERVNVFDVDANGLLGGFDIDDAFPGRNTFISGTPHVIGDGERYMVATGIGLVTFDLDGSSQSVEVDTRSGLQGPIAVMDDRTAFASGLRGGLWRADVVSGEPAERTIARIVEPHRCRGERRGFGRRGRARFRLVDRAVRRIDVGADRRTDPGWGRR